MNSLRDLDTLREYGLLIGQPEQGYRFSLDPLLLARFCRLPKAGGQVIDLGTGSGVIPLVLARLMDAARFVGVENNSDMAALAAENFRLNRLEERIEIVTDDILNLRERYPVSSFDLVVSNPPFRTPASGRVSPHAGRDTARHETTAGLADFLATAKYLVRPEGRICFVHHPSRLAEFISQATGMKLALLRLRMVHGSVGAEAKIFMAELAKSSRGGLTAEPPLIVYDGSGNYTAETAAMLGAEQRKA